MDQNPKRYTEKEKEKTNLNVFYEKSYSRKFCSKFFPSKNNPLICQGCAYDEAHHKDESGLKKWSKEGSKWRPELHINNRFQKILKKITFVNQLENFEKLADFTIVADDSHPKIILDCLLKEWKLQKPNLVISVTGSQRNISITSQQFQRLKNGFMSAASSTQSWIITGGTSQGVDAIVSESLKEAQYVEWMGKSLPKFYMIGFSNWNCIDQNERINKWIENSQLPYRYYVKQRKQVAKSYQRQDMFQLNPLNSHFICIESGVRGKIGVEIPVRSSVEQFLVRSLHDEVDGLAGFAIPSVLIVLGGEFDTFERCAKALYSGLPVLLCEGIGGASDILCYALRAAVFEDTEVGKVLSEEQEDIVRNDMEILLNVPKPKYTLFSEEPFEAAKNMHFVKECLRMHKQIHIYRIDRFNEMTLDQCILKALIGGKIASESDPVGLALTWHRCDDVVRDILINDGDINARPLIDQLMTQAILENQIDFVSLFLEFGFEFISFLTPTKLAEFYKHTCDNHPALVKLLDKTRGFGQGKWTHCTLNDIYKICYLFTSSLPELDLIDRDGARLFGDPFREMCIWAVLSNRMEASVFFWTHSKNPLILSVICSKLWRGESNALAIEENDLEDEMKQNELRFMHYGLAIINECWNTNKPLSQELLLHIYPKYGGKTILDVAGFIEAKEILAHPCSQVTIEDQWKRGLRCKLSQIILALFCPMLISDLKFNVSSKLSQELDWNDEDFNKFEETADENPDNKDIEMDNFSKIGNFTDKAIVFYNAPVTKFCSHTFAYLIFLGLFTNYYLFNLTPGTHTLMEYMIFSFMMSYLFEEIRQLMGADATWAMKIKLWTLSEWNLLDAAYLIIGVTAFFMSPSHDPWFSYSKGLYAIVCILMWTRLLRFYQCSSRLGPIWIMIRKMLLETCVFMSVLGVFLMAGGVSSFAIGHVYNFSDVYSYDTAAYWLILRPFYMFNGELFIDSYEGYSTTLITLNFIMTLFFLFIGNALLLNLLIAIYSEIFSTVSEVSDVEWKNEMFQLLKEYEDKTYLPPPFSLVETIFGLFKLIFCKIDVSVTDVDVQTSPKLGILVNYCLDKVLRSERSHQTSEDKVEKLIKHIDQQESKILDGNIVLRNLRRSIAAEKKKKEEKKKSKERNKKVEFEETSEDDMVIAENKGMMLFASKKSH